MQVSMETTAMTLTFYVVFDIAYLQRIFVQSFMNMTRFINFVLIRSTYP